MIKWDYVKVDSCCHSVSVSLIWHRPPLVPCQDKCPSNKISLCQISTCRAIRLSCCSVWPLRLAAQIAVTLQLYNKDKKNIKINIPTQVLKVRFLLQISIIFTHNETDVMPGYVFWSTSVIFSQMLQHCFIYWLFLCV